MIAWQKEDFFPPPPLDARAGWVANQVVRFGRLGQKSAIILGTVAIARIHKNKKSGVTRQLLQELNYNLAMRYVSSGIELLNRHEHLFASVGPEQTNSAAFVGCLAQWVDIGYGEPNLIEQMLARFPREKRGHLSVNDYLQLRMAEGLLALLRDNPDEALRQFDLVLSMQDEI